MKIKPILKAVETAANVIIVAGAAKAIYNKFSSSDDDDEDEDDEIDEDDDEEDQWKAYLPDCPYLRDYNISAESRQETFKYDKVINPLNSVEYEQATDSSDQTEQEAEGETYSHQRTGHHKESISVAHTGSLTATHKDLDTNK